MLIEYCTILRSYLINHFVESLLSEGLRHEVSTLSLFPSVRFQLAWSVVSGVRSGAILLHNPTFMLSPQHFLLDRRHNTRCTSSGTTRARLPHGTLSLCLVVNLAVISCASLSTHILWTPMTPYWQVLMR